MGVYSFLFLIFCVTAENVSAKRDTFSEEMFVKPLQNGHVYTYFQFTTQIEKTETSFEHYYLFPKSLGEVLHKYDVQELHLSLTQSLWRYEKWGYPMEDSPPGAELWVWFKEKKTDIDSSWFELINILSGMFCASLNFMDAKATIVPKISFRPQGATTYIYDRYQTQNVRYAALPKELVCTENLTPWKKLLPCGSRSGLASLFHGMKLYDTSYHSLGLHFRQICQDSECEMMDYELKQSLSVVFDPTVISSSQMQDWSIKKLFGRVLGSSCPLASLSKIYVDITSNKTSDTPYTLQPTPTEVTEMKRATSKLRFAIYDIPQFVSGGKLLSLEAKYSGPIVYSVMSPPVLHTQRFQTGYGQDKGGITTLLYNSHPRRDLVVAFMETAPWFVKLYYHTLSIESFPLDDQQQRHSFDANGTKITPDHVHYIPGRDRQKPYHLELLLTLPAKSVTRLSIQFDRALLKWTEYPPDANHGFYVNSAVISTAIPTARHYTALAQNMSTISQIFTDESTSFFLRLHTESLLITLPTPDFSMPYNVICLACTVIAIAFGSLHNLTTRQFKAVDPATRKGILTKVKEKLFGRKKTEDIVAPDGKIEEVDVGKDGDVEDFGDGDKSGSSVGGEASSEEERRGESSENMSQGEEAGVKAGLSESQTDATGVAGRKKSKKNLRKRKT